MRHFSITISTTIYLHHFLSRVCPFYQRFHQNYPQVHASNTPTADNNPSMAPVVGPSMAIRLIGSILRPFGFAARQDPTLQQTDLEVGCLPAPVVSTGGYASSTDCVSLRAFPNGDNDMVMCLPSDLVGEKIL